MYNYDFNFNLIILIHQKMIFSYRNLLIYLLVKKRYFSFRKLIINPYILQISLTL
jgi:hypothetical protein